MDHCDRSRVVSLDPTAASLSETELLPHRRPTRYSVVTPCQVPRWERRYAARSALLLTRALGRGLQRRSQTPPPRPCRHAGGCGPSAPCARARPQSPSIRLKNLDYWLAMLAMHPGALYAAALHNRPSRLPWRPLPVWGRRPIRPANRCAAVRSDSVSIRRRSWAWVRRAHRARGA